MNKQTKMKLLIVVSLLFIFSVPYAVAQENLVTVNLEHVSLKEVLNAIEKQTTYRFFISKCSSRHEERCYDIKG